MYDAKIIKAFLDNQLKLYPETVAENEDEARDFLEMLMPAVADSTKDVINYLKDVGVDTAGMTKDQIMSMPEIFAIGDGRFLILEI